MAQTTKAPGSPTPAVYALTLGSQADALGLTGTQFAAPTATKNGASIAITGYAWTVTGPCTLDDDEIERPTPTHTGAGTCTRQLAATLADGAVVYSAVDGWRVGTTTGWVRVWKYLPSEQADHNFLTTDLVVSGVTIKKLGTGTSEAISSGVHTTVTASGSDLGIYIRPIEALASPGQYEVCFVAGCGANITANSDGMYIMYQWTGGSTTFFAEARRVAGVQKIKCERNGGSASSVSTSGGSQARVVGLHLTPGRYQGRPLYSATAWSGNGPSPDDLTIGGGTPSGWHVSADVTPAETTDEFGPDSAVGAGHDACWVAFRGDNSRTYTLAGFSMWARLRAG